MNIAKTDKEKESQLIANGWVCRNGFWIDPKPIGITLAAAYHRFLDRQYEKENKHND